MKNTIKVTTEVEFILEQGYMETHVRRRTYGFRQHVTGQFIPVVCEQAVLQHLQRTPNQIRLKVSNSPFKGSHVAMFDSVTCEVRAMDRWTDMYSVLQGVAQLLLNARTVVGKPHYGYSRHFWQISEVGGPRCKTGYKETHKTVTPK